MLILFSIFRSTCTRGFRLERFSKLETSVVALATVLHTTRDIKRTIN